MSSNDRIRFIAGASAASTAEVLTLPIDCIKVRLQTQSMLYKTIQYTGIMDTLKHIAKAEGILALWKGIVPAVVRQASYSSLCMVLYEPLRNQFSSKSTESTYLQKLLAGGIGGALSISIVNPVDIIKVRMQADISGKLYTGFVDAGSKILQHEGYRGFFKGLGPNLSRGFIVNAAELGTYDQSKQIIISNGIAQDGIFAHIGASFIAGLAGASASNPVDVIKTRLMTQPTDIKGQGVLYKGFISCGIKILRNEGFAALYYGFFPNWLRKTPWCITFFVTYEKYQELISSNQVSYHMKECDNM